MAEGTNQIVGTPEMDPYPLNIMFLLILNSLVHFDNLVALSKK